MNINDIRTLLIAYSEYLEKRNFIDSDWWSEETPNTVEQFLLKLEKMDRGQK